jgi:transposase InsO family protein
VNKDSSTRWTTAAGTFETSAKSKIELKLNEFYEQRVLNPTVHVTKARMGYDMIIGRDLMSELGIDIRFSDSTVIWDERTISMKPFDSTMNSSYEIADSPAVTEATSRLKQILDAKYEKADLDAVCDDCTNLTGRQRDMLKRLLEKHESLFDGTLGHWRGETYDIELKPDAKPYHARAYPIPKAYEQQLRLEVERLEQLGVLKRKNNSEWAAPVFIIPKKDQTIRFLNDFRELNKRIKRKPFPIPKIQDLLLKLEGFQYATSLDLNMGYYHIELSPRSKTYCTLVLPWGKYECQRLPMGLCNSPDIFQEKMNTLMGDLEYVRAYIDDILCLTSGDFEDHLDKLDEVLQRLKDAGLKVNAKKSFFGRTELEYLGYWITRDGIQPLPKKVDAMKNIAPPKTKRQLRSFIGLINYYRDAWIRRSDITAPLTALCGKNAKWRWTEIEQKAFDMTKRLVSREVLLSYPVFNETFDIHTDASDTQLGSVISQKGKPIAFYSRKLNNAQRRYTTTEQELLAIVETLKEFRNILLGQTIRVYTDHKNLTYQNFNTDRVLRWRLILEEYGPELIYIQGEKNIVADALSRLDFDDSAPSQNEDANPVYLAEAFGLDEEELPSDAFPLTYKNIRSKQQTDKKLLKLLRSDKNYQVKVFRGGEKKISIICRKDKIVIPTVLQKRVVEWYHTQLCHPGETRTEANLRQHFWWPNLREDVAKHCKTCKPCQIAKRTDKKYGHLPMKEAEAVPWQKLCVDLIGRYEIRRKAKKTLHLWCVTMIDPATGWFEMREISNKKADYIANVVEQAWLTRYPKPEMILFDQGKEFMAEFASMVKNDYGIKRKPCTKRNPQANAIIERVHKTLGNIIRTFEFYDESIDESDPWSGILAAAMFAIRATYHTTLQATPMQLVFGRDAIMNSAFEADWNFIRQRKQDLIRKNNLRENAKRISHEYKVNDKVLMSTTGLSKYSNDPWTGPYTITKVNTNGTIQIRNGIVTELVNIRLVKPFFE